MPNLKLRVVPFSGTLKDRLSNEDHRPRPGEVQLFWLGQAGFVIESHHQRWLIDPYLSDSLARKYRGKKYDHVA